MALPMLSTSASGAAGSRKMVSTLDFGFIPGRLGEKELKS